MRLLLALAAIFLTSAADAQGFPSKPVRILVGFSAGGAPDILARMLGPKLQEELGQPVLVENKPGAAGNVAADAVAKSAPDGYVLLMGNASLAISTHANPKPPFDPAQDLEPIGMVSSQPLMLVVNASLPVNSARELVDYAKANPGKLNYASVGYGSAHHLSGELLASMAGAPMVHVPYKGGGVAVQGLLGGEVQLLFLTPLALMPHVRAGKLRALGVTSTKRTPVAPEVPTLAEAGLPGFDVDYWHAVFAPRGTPREVVGRLNTGLNRVLTNAAIKELLLASQGAEPWPSTPEEARALVRAEIPKWGKIIQTSGAKLE